MFKILLFSPKGAGDHYYGPGMNAFRMYQNLDTGRATVSLAHGFEDQKYYDLFENQYYLSEVINGDIISGLKFLKSARRWIRENAHHFDVVHVLTAFHHSFMVAYWFEQAGVPVFIKIGQSDHTGFYHNSLFSRLVGLKRFRQMHANDMTGYISISDEIRQNLEGAGIDTERIHDIPNGVDTERFKPVKLSVKRSLREQLGLKDRFTVIFTGAFCDRKSPLLVARGFHKAVETLGCPADLLLIGPDTDDGSHRRKVESFIRENEITNIFTSQHVDNIEEYYQAADLFVLPSSEEGFSNSMLEAQASGLPVLVTRISGSVDLVEEGVNGLFVARSPESISNAIETYYSDPPRLQRESVNSRKKIVENYSSATILDRHLQLFENALTDGY